jgi:hypothetical protein
MIQSRLSYTKLLQIIMIWQFLQGLSVRKLSGAIETSFKKIDALDCKKGAAIENKMHF